MNFPWRDGNRVELLINGEEYFPRLFQCIAEARREILLETFIIFEDEVGRQLQEALSAAAERGVEVQVTVDGYGTASLSTDYLARLTAAGVRVHLFDPRPRLLGMRTNLFRRLHRKLVVIDRRQAFVGGINYGEDHLVRRGNMAKQDYAVRVEGPVVRDIRQACLALLEPDADYPPLRPSGAGQPARVRLVIRDNDQSSDDIEREYLQAIRQARRRLLIANAYFFPATACFASCAMRRAGACASTWYYRACRTCRWCACAAGCSTTTCCARACVSTNTASVRCTARSR